MEDRLKLRFTVPLRMFLNKKLKHWIKPNGVYSVKSNKRIDELASKLVDCASETSACKQAIDKLKVMFFYVNENRFMCYFL